MERQEMIAQIEKYKMDSGFYDTTRMFEELEGRDPLEATFAAFFSDNLQDDDDGEINPLIALAEELNAGLNAEADKVEQAETQAALERFVAGTSRNADKRLLVKRGLAVEEYDDPESNAPTGIHLRDRRDIDGNIYSDQVGIEENPPRR